MGIAQASRGRLACCVLAALLVAIAGCSSKPPGALPPPPVSSAAPPHVTTYTTNFPLHESPISEAGRWIGGKSAGLDWGDVSTEPWRATGRAGPKKFADSVALLTGHWGPDQTVEGVVDRRRIKRAPEVSLRLRSSLAPHWCNGYEISFAAQDSDPYVIIVRWNGPLADFTYLVNAHAAQYGVKTGDVVKATIVGNVITAYKNGVQMAQATDSAFAAGQPGFGFNEGRNGDYGFTRITVTAADATPSRPESAPQHPSKR